MNLCEEDLSNERKGHLHRGHTDVHTHGHRNSMTESAQWADSVKNVTCQASGPGGTPVRTCPCSIVKPVKNKCRIHLTFAKLQIYY